MFSWALPGLVKFDAPLNVEQHFQWNGGQNAADSVGLCSECDFVDCLGLLLSSGQHHLTNRDLQRPTEVFPQANWRVRHRLGAAGLHHRSSREHTFHQGRDIVRFAPANNAAKIRTTCNDRVVFRFERQELHPPRFIHRTASRSGLSLLLPSFRKLEKDRRLHRGDHLLLFLVQLAAAGRCARIDLHPYWAPPEHQLPSGSGHNREHRHLAFTQATPPQDQLDDFRSERGGAHQRHRRAGGLREGDERIWIHGHCNRRVLRNLADPVLRYVPSGGVLFRLQSRVVVHRL